MPRSLLIVFAAVFLGAAARTAETSAPVDDAIARGLEWLSRHQSPDGHWDSDGFEEKCHDLCGGRGHPLYDQGVTGLAILAIVESGRANGDPSLAGTVRRGLDWLGRAQDDEGCFTSRVAHNFTYSHAIATLVFARAIAATGDMGLKPPLERAIRFIERCRNPYKAWRYGMSPGDNDSSVTGWMVHALAAARDAGVETDARGLETAQAFLDDLTDPTGRVGYMQRGSGPVRLDGAQDFFPSDQSESLTAEGLSASLAMGRRADHPIAVKQQDRILRKLPLWDTGAGTIDLYYWYYGALALERSGGDRDGVWVEALRRALLPTQRRDGERAGSWDPIDAWGETGGRIYSTAMATLALAHTRDLARAEPPGKSAATTSTQELLERLERLERENAALRRKLDEMKKILEGEDDTQKR